MQLRAIQRILGLLLALFSLTMVPPMVVSWWFADGAMRPVTCTSKPNAACAWYTPVASFSGTPGEPCTSSAVPNCPSAPGLTENGVRGSPPPASGRWQVPHDTVIEADDHVILFLIDKKRVPEVERLFQVGVTFL